MNKIICPYCNTEAKIGHSVCLGCKAEIVYGATINEQDNAALFSGVVIGILSIFILLGVSINGHMIDIDIFYKFIISFVNYHIGKYIGRRYIIKSMRNKIRFFRFFHNY